MTYRTMSFSESSVAKIGRVAMKNFLEAAIADSIAFP